MSKKPKFDWNGDADPAANARINLPPLVSAWFARVRKLLAGNPEPPELHCLRLETKKLRYTLELFRPCYGPGLETRMQDLRKLQQLLGEVNDSAATSRLLENAMRKSAERTRVEAYLSSQAAAKAVAVRKLWIEVFEVEGCEAKWTAYLERQARTPGRRPR